MASFPQIITRVSNLETAKTNLETSIANTTVIIRDELRAEIEHASEGRNTVIRDKSGAPHTMVVIPKFRVEDIDASLGSGVHPAFIVNGAEVSELLVGKYIASKGTGNVVQTAPRKDPWCSITFDNALTACRALNGNGVTGFTMASNAIWAARALWLMKETGKTWYPGNTNYGRDVTKKWQTGTLTNKTFKPGDTASNPGRTLTGSGPDEWNDDGTPFGISDLVGNVWEWCSGLRLLNGEIQVLENNNALMANVDMTKTSTLWKAINTSNAYATPGTNGTLKWDSTTAYTKTDWTSLGDVAKLTSGAVTKWMGPQNDDSFAMQHSYGVFRTIKKEDDLTVPALAKQLAIYPYANDEKVVGGCWICNAGERLAFRGGNWHNGSHCGPFYVALNNPRSHSRTYIGFRVAYLTA